ncbi:MAG: translation initiation factor IF-2 N-terminal domain-containing protein, partial [Oscillospiraceae bacterium]|nr:translation initiation factor IF-2 N-terminal domain-containing protein [Oscillospiraceae bacterium]
MSSFDKYRIHEVAKDFGVPSKVITKILTDYVAPPKNHMQVLETEELDVIFEYMTQHNQVASIEEVFAAPKPAQQPKQQQQPKSQQQPSAAQQQSAQQAKQSGAAGQSGAGKKTGEQKPHKAKPVVEKRIIDTRGSSNTN